MAIALPVPINPSVLAWARMESGHGVDRVADRLQVTAQKVEAWERGEQSPTLRQLQELAKFLHRPFSIFFQPSPPRVPALATEYRRLPGVQPGKESPELRLALRQMIQRRELAEELMGEVGDRPRQFGLVAHLNEPPQAVGERLRASLAISIAQQLAWRDEWQAWREWRGAVESAGVLVFQFPKVELNESRGLSLLHFPIPVIGINSKEQPESKSFTLLHEAVHLMLAVGHEERPASSETRPDAEWRILEQFAESCASHALIPEADLRLVAGADERSWDLTEVRKLARRYRVTPLAMATRLRTSGMMSWNAYARWKELWSGYVASLPPRSGGFAHPADISLSRHGRPYVSLVLEALSANRITSVDAARHLGLKYQHFDKLKASLLTGPGSRELGEANE